MHSNSVCHESIIKDKSGATYLHVGTDRRLNNERAKKERWLENNSRIIVLKIDSNNCFSYLFEPSDCKSNLSRSHIWDKDQNRLLTLTLLLPERKHAHSVKFNKPLPQRVIVQS